MKTVVLLFTLSIVICACSSQSSDKAIEADQGIPVSIPRNGLIGWWPFSGNTNDESGNRNHGIAIDNPKLVPDRFGKAHSAYAFNSRKGKIAVKMALPTGSAPRTAACWIRTSADVIPTFSYPYLQTALPSWPQCPGRSGIA